MKIDRLPPPEPDWVDLEFGEKLLSCPSWVCMAGVQVIGDDGRSYRVVIAGDAYPEDGDTRWINVSDGGHYVPNPMDPGTQGALTALLLTTGLGLPLPESGDGTGCCAPRLRIARVLHTWGRRLVSSLIGREGPKQHRVATVTHSSRGAVDCALRVAALGIDAPATLYATWVAPGHFLIQSVVPLTPDERIRVEQELRRLPASGYRSPVVAMCENG